MKVHQQQKFTHGLWDQQEITSLSLSCKHLRPLAPKLPKNDVVSTTTASFDLKSFIRPDSGPRKLAPTPPSDLKKDTLQVEAHPGGTRWNPTPEQIGILEALYCRGMRTPNAQQIEQISTQLSKYGKIEGKNVFYWFQNHKARERQKQKRSKIHGSLPQTTSFLSSTTTSSITLSLDSTKEEYWKREEQVATPLSKRKCRSWAFESLIEDINCIRSTNNKSGYYLNDFKEQEEEDGVKKITLDLFPLHPETR